jgi:methionine-rich copper-binding protein CopC
MKRRKLAPFGACLIALFVTASKAAWAHSFPEEQNPAAGQTLAAAPSAVSIKYDAPIEHLFAKLEVVDGAGNELTASQPEVSSDGLILSVKVKPLKPGDYTVKWAVVCIDTHHAQGSYTFSVSGAHSGS